MRAHFGSCPDDGTLVDDGRRIDALFVLAATWILPHSFGRVPMVQVFLGAAGSGGEEVIADVAATSATITVTHASPQSGFVLIN